MQKMKTAGLAAVLAMIVIGMTPLVTATSDGDGEATAGNIAPEVTSAEPSPDNIVDLTLASENFNCTVRDNNTLADIDNVQLILYTTDATVDGENHIENHYVFWFDPTDNSFYSVLGAAYIDNESSSYPSDLTENSDNYNFVVKLSGGAKAGTDWHAKWTAVDDNENIGSMSDTFEVLEYISLSILPATQTFSGDPGDMGQTATEGAITCTVTANTNFDIATKLFADWEGTTYGGTIGADNTHASGGSSIDLSTVYADVWTNVTFGEDVTNDITYTLDLPVPLRDDVYTATININAEAV